MMELGNLLGAELRVRQLEALVKAMEYLVHALRDGPVEELPLRHVAHRQGIPDSTLDDACRRFAVQVYVLGGIRWWELKSDA